MAKVIDVKIGDKFNRWEVSSEVFRKVFPNGSSAKFVDCVCQCGNKSTVRLSTLTNKKTPSISCGCFKDEVMCGLRSFPTIGEVFNRLTTVSEGWRENNRSYVSVICSCDSAGNPFKVRIDAIKSGSTSSCGCVQKESVSLVMTTHGMSGTSAYSSWQAMRDRCTNPNNSRWSRYGGRGIAYPVKWNTFCVFWEDMSTGWFEGADIDRIDFDGNYSVENCRWVNRDVGNHNKSKSSGTSSYKGVYYDKCRDKWVAKLYRNGIRYLQTRLSCEVAAATAYDDISEQIYGDRPNKTKRND